MQSMDCAFASCGAQVTHNDKDLCITLYNAHIATHKAIGAGEEALRSRELTVMRPKIKPGISWMEWEAFKLSFNLFKTTTDVQLDKIVHQLLSCLDRDLLKLLYWENNKPEKLTEEENTNRRCSRGSQKNQIVPWKLVLMFSWYLDLKYQSF